MKFIFIRHAKDDDKYRGGWSNLGITEEGEIQANKLAKYLEKNKNNLDIIKIVSSDLKRAKDTANIINKYLNKNIELEEQLREMNNGDLAGILNEKALIEYPGLFYNRLEMKEKYPNGESPIEFYNRIKEWFISAISKYKDEDKNILFVTHSGVINIIYYIIKDLTWSNKEKSFKIANCSIHILDITKKEFITENYVNHLL